MYLCRTLSLPSIQSIGVYKACAVSINSDYTQSITSLPALCSGRYTSQQLTYQKLIALVLILLSMVPHITCQPAPQTSSTYPHHSNASTLAIVDTGGGTAGGHSVTVQTVHVQPTTAINTDSLSSCQLYPSNYTTDLCDDLDILDIDNETAPHNLSCVHSNIQSNYSNFVELMEKYDCRSNDSFLYSRKSDCTQCMKTYKQWLCSQHGSYNYNGKFIKSCRYITCQQVKRACPYIHPVNDGTDYFSEPGFICNAYGESIEGDEEGDVTPCYFFNDPEGNEGLSSAAIAPYNDTDIRVLVSSASSSAPSPLIQLSSQMNQLNQLLVALLSVAYKLYS